MASAVSPGSSQVGALNSDDAPTLQLPLGALVDSAEDHLGSAPAMPSSGAELRNVQMDRGELQWFERVGKGSTADVFKGSWHGKQVAIKRLKVPEGSSALVKQQVQFLVRETTILEKISHRHLVKFHGLVFDQMPYLLITEFCTGGTCFHLVHSDHDLQMETKQQLKICCDTAHAMDYLHKFQPQIIHRDLKSLNLLLLEPVTSTSDIPHVKLCDFGFSRMKSDGLGDWGEMTKEVGSPHWMAPEMATGSYNEKVDIYSFSMVLFEILGQEIPFDDLEISEVLKCATKGARPDLEAIPPWIPISLVELMVQCWAQQPSCRPSFEHISAILDATAEKMLT